MMNENTVSKQEHVTVFPDDFVQEDCHDPNQPSCAQAGSSKNSATAVSVSNDQSIGIEDQSSSSRKGMSSMATSSTNDDTITDGERLLANDLKALTLKERETVFEDVHGIDRHVEETQQFVSTKIKELEREVREVRDKDAYSKAAFLSPQSVLSQDLRLKVLRACQWNVPKAAVMITNYFQTKLTLFGEERFVRPIQFSDLQNDARESLQAGAIMHHESRQTTAVGNAAGRNVVIYNSACFRFETVESLIQSMWYINATVLPQKQQASAAIENNKGLISICNLVDASPNQIYILIEAVRLMTKWGLSRSVPVRHSSNYLCFAGSWIRPSVSTLLQVMSTEMRLRTKLHFGSTTEIMCALSTYGIPSSLLPLSSNGTQHLLEMVQHYLQYKRDCETLLRRNFSRLKPAHCIHCPMPNDILLGRGWPYQSYSGNMQLTELLMEQRDEYILTSSRSEKTAMSAMLVTIVKQGGARFVKRDGTGNYWEEVSDTAARQKIAMSLRNLTRK